MPAPREAAREAAESIIANMKRAYSAPHTIVPASESEFDHLELDAYRSFRDTMERHGYRFLSDFTIPGITNPPGSLMLPTMIRSMVSTDGETCAGHYQVKTGIGRRFENLLLGLLAFRFIAAPRALLQSLKTKNFYDFESELAGQYVVTSNAEDAGTISLPSSVDARFFAYKTPVDELHAAHEERLRAAARRTGARPTIMSSKEDVLAMQARL